MGYETLLEQIKAVGAWNSLSAFRVLIILSDISKYCSL